MGAHHDGIQDERMKEFAEKFFKGKDKLGATGEFPQGKLTPYDQGEIKMAIGVEQNKVVIHFGKEVAWIGFDRKQAIELAGLLIDHAAKCSTEAS
jgi:hypothetical protein